MKDLFSKGRSALSFLADLAGALVFVSAAIGLLVAAFLGAALAAWTAFPQPYFTFLVVGVALLGTGCALHFFRNWLTPPPPIPARPEQTAVSTAADNPYSQASLLQRRHEKTAEVKAKRDAEVAMRRAVRRIREELLDNDRAVSRSGSDPDELLHVRFGQWQGQQSVLLDADDPEPHERASEAYRQIRGILTGRVHDDNMGGSYTNGRLPTSSEISNVRRAIDKAAQVLQAAEATAANAVNLED